MLWQKEMHEKCIGALYLIPFTDMMDLTSCTLKMPPGLSSIPTNAYWQSKLEVAQNVLFCKELFAQVNALIGVIYDLLS